MLSAPASIVCLLLLMPTLTSGGVRSERNDRPVLEPRARTNRYAVVPLDSDGFVQAPGTDTNLANAWGLTVSGTGLWWVANNGSDRATVYRGDGTAQPLVVALPLGAAPTGVEFYPGNDFVLTDGALSGPARFLFAAENGTISGWGPAVSPPGSDANTVMAVDRSASGASYKGIAVASTGAGDRLYVTDFEHRRIDAFDGWFAPVALSEDAFVDPLVPPDFAPFGIRNIQGRIVVTFASRPGQGLGFVSAFDTDGTFLGRIGTRGLLDSPWGLALAPAAFGRFSGDLLVGNSGDGRIVAFKISDDLRTAEPDGLLLGPDGQPIVIDGLRSLRFGNGASAAPLNTLFFTAGPDGGRHGLFGRIEHLRFSAPSRVAGTSAVFLGHGPWSDASSDSRESGNGR